MVLVFGTVCLDRIRRVAALPVSGGYVEVLEEHESLGGEAANTASALALWRVEVVLAGNALGEGHDGDRLRRLLLETGISDEWFPHERPISAIGASYAGPHPTPVCDVYVGDDGDRTMFGAGFGRMEPCVPLDHLPFEAGRWFTAETNMREAAERAAWLAHGAGMKVYAMDFHHHEGQVPPGSIAQFSTDWVGERNQPVRNLAWVGAWSDHNGSTAILTDGANGLFLAHPGGTPLSLPTFPAPFMVDSTGAGDVFRAGVLRALDRGDGLGAGLVFGAAAASLKVGTLGASEGVPTLAEVSAHVEAHPDIGVRLEHVPPLPPI